MRIDPNKSENIKDVSLCFISISNEALIKVKHVILINVSYLFLFFLSYHTYVYVFQKEYSEDGVSHMNLLQLCWKKKKKLKPFLTQIMSFAMNLKKIPSH